MGEAINLVNNFKVEKVIFNCCEFNDLENVLNKEIKKTHLTNYDIHIDKNIKTTNRIYVGNIICKQDSKYVIKYCSDGISKYKCQVVSKLYWL